MSNILKALNQRPIAYYPAYRKLTGTTTAGIFLSQIMYWFSKKDTFYKTDSDIMEETLLTLGELKSAKIRIKSLDFITITKKGIPAKTYYTIDWKLFEEALKTQFSQIDETCLETTEQEFDLTKQDESILPVQSSQIDEPIYDISMTKTSSKTSSKKEEEEENIFYDLLDDYIWYITEGLQGVRRPKAYRDSILKKLKNRDKETTESYISFKTKFSNVVDKTKFSNVVDESSESIIEYFDAIPF